VESFEDLTDQHIEGENLERVLALFLQHFGEKKVPYKDRFCWQPFVFPDLHKYRRTYIAKRITEAIRNGIQAISGGKVDKK
jgi:hypothetical protein